MTTAQTPTKRTKTGTVISVAMEKTAVVMVERVYTHPKLRKVIRSRKKYKVHDEQKLARVHDIVEIIEGRPVSKTKHMYLARIITRGGTES